MSWYVTGILVPKQLVVKIWSLDLLSESIGPVGHFVVLYKTFDLHMNAFRKLQAVGLSHHTQRAFIGTQVYVATA